MKMMEVQDLTYSYDEHSMALDHVSLTIRGGRTTAILGGNGAGKSTLFLNLNGVLQPDSGRVIIDGEPAVYNKKGIRRLRQSIGIVFQDPNDQLFSADVRKDISFGPMNLGLSVPEVRQRVERAMELTGTREYADRPTYALSYGQKKRVAIAGVLAMEPDVMILDEPTAGLDPAGCSDILRLLERLQREEALTIVLATHEMDIVPLYCDDVYVMEQGRIVMQGTVESILKQPEALRSHHLRLPRIGHLMEVLSREDGLQLSTSAATVGSARREILKVIKDFR